jgi:hypothetical protein
MRTDNYNRQGMVNKFRRRVVKVTGFYTTLMILKGVVLFIFLMAK